MKQVNEILALKKRVSKGDRVIIEKAYQFAKKAHKGQKISEHINYPYFAHPAKAGWWMAKLDMSAEIICSALLHDVVEDCEVSLELIRKEFGEVVAFYVDGMSWFRSWDFKERRYLKDWRGYFEKFAEYSKHDINLVLLKIADEISKGDSTIPSSKIIDRKKHEKKTVSKSIVNNQIFWIPLYQELGFSKLAESMSNWLKKEGAKPSMSQLSKHYSLSELHKMKKQLKSSGGFEFLR